MKLSDLKLSLHLLGPQLCNEGLRQISGFQVNSLPSASDTVSELAVPGTDSKILCLRGFFDDSWGD